MTCVEVRARISAYYDREVPTAEHARITAHLADCPACCALHRDLARLGELLRPDDAGEVPDRLWDRIEEAARRTPPARRREARAWFVRVTAAAAGFALYVCGFGALTSAPRTVPPTHSSTPIELALRETGAAFARTGSLAGPAGLFEQRPEARFLRELIEDTQP